MGKIAASDLSLLYREHSDALYSFGCKFTSDRKMVEDCIHDVFLKLYERKEGTNDIRNLRLFLLVSLKNRLLKELSSPKLFVSIEEIPFSYAPQDASVEDIHLENDRILNRKIYIQKALESLTNRQREIVYLHFIEELDYDQICQMMGISYQTIRNTVHNALTRLRDKLGKPPIHLYFMVIFKKIRKNS
ncbi:MAG: sigma-70 family RNA polymerase sigma factor [Dysgonamonadaceae bacterium]|jgi:RNA polymerase sigma factor (sigma-70 family)|nr:sigma-70 family RNA polymerase sigma factor [Dysgonamonadaceae bacterium]